MSATELRSIGPYVLHAPLGRGATAEVFAAQHRETGARVALKLLKAELAGDPGATEAFLSEAAKTRAIAHPGVVRLHDFGLDAPTGAWFLAMEHVDGESLAARLARERRLDEATARVLFAAVADGAEAAHARGIIHRDLKPANIMLGAAGPKLVDFGIAKVLGNASALATGRRAGTPAYMAPEQLTGEMIAPCTDVWAIGVCLFEAVTGRRPFEGFADGALPQLVAPAPSARSVAAVSPSLDRLIARCLERDPARRPTMAELASALREDAPAEEHVTEDVTLPAPDAPAAAPRARRRVWWLGGALAIAAFAAIAVTGFVATRDTHEPPAAASIAASPVEPAVAAPAPAPAPSSDLAPAPSPAPSPTFEVHLRSTPPGAAIVVDGAPRGTTPARLALAAPASIELRRAGYRPATVRAERAGPLEVTLEAVRTRPAKRTRTRTTTSTTPRETLD